MRFQVPQFIEVESKIFGPLTLKQFIYLAGGGGMIFMLKMLLPFWLTIIFAVPIGALAFALAFYKVNNRPFIKLVEDAARFSAGSRVYIWKKTEPKKKKELEEAKKAKERPEILIPKLTKGKLKDLAWSLDVKESIK